MSEEWWRVGLAFEFDFAVPHARIVSVALFSLLSLFVL
jgi:hypothetical protein